MPTILLLDNGSVKAAATLQLRELAEKLSAACQQPVFPVSLSHADKIPASELNGEPARLFKTFTASCLQQEQRSFIVLPLFFGPSKAVTSLIPQQVAELQAQFGEFDIQVSDTIYPLPGGEPRLLDILYDHIKESTQAFTHSLSNLVLVDHGSPSPAVTAVRQNVCEQLRDKLPAEARLEQAVMERRQGSQYDFNGELLEDWLETCARSGASSAVVILLFFLPGRHAGSGGDIEAICQSVMDRHADFTVHISPLISSHPALIDILSARLAATAS